MGTLKVVIITQGITRIVKPLFENKLVKVIGICESAGRKKETLVKKALRKIKPSNNLKKLCKDKSVPYFLLNKANYNNFDEWLKDKNPDIIIVYSMSQLLRKPTIDIPRLGIVNIHPSYLPLYRGPNPWFWQYYDMQKEFGVTLHYIDEGMDSGDIIYQEKYPVPLGMKSPEMHDRAIGKIANRMLADFITCISKGENPQRSKQKDIEGIVARNISPKEHGQIIQWNEWDIKRIWHLLRGTELWLNCIPQPKGVYAGQRWSVQEFEIRDTTKYTTGNIYSSNGRNFLACSDGLIYLNITLNVKNTLLHLLKKLGIWN